MINYLATQKNWQNAFSDTITSFAELAQALDLPIDSFDSQVGQFPLKVPRRFVQKMGKGDIHDPLLKQVLPTFQETVQVTGFVTDPLDEQHANPVKGIIHKYASRVLIPVTGACVVNCRYCFRQHFDYHENLPTQNDWQAISAYITAHPAVNEVILSGGDPLSLSNRRLLEIFTTLEALPQVQTMTYLTGTTRRKICIRQKFKLPSNLSDILDSYATGTGVRWMEFLAIKNGNLTDPNGGTDSRFTIQAVRLNGETGMCYRFQFDSGAGGGTIYWGPFHSTEGSLVPGVWHEYIVYFEQPAYTSDTINGICQVVIKNLVSGEIVATLNKRGGQFYGSLGRNISRISSELCYTGGWPATGQIEISFSDREFSENPRYPLDLLPYL